MGLNKSFAFNSRLRLYERIYDDDGQFHDSLEIILKMILDTLKLGGKILIFGNGGSAAEAQHFAAELVCQFKKKRRAFAAISLTTDSSILTAQSNDFNFNSVFSRQIEAICTKKDLVIGLTTSDADGTSSHSANIYNAFLAAQKIGAKSVGFFSQKTQKLLRKVDASIIVPSEETELIQEVHLAAIHILCGWIEDQI